MATHRLKTHSGPFTAIWNGLKQWEFRIDDRSPRFDVGDTLELVEWDHENKRETAFRIVARVPYILKGPTFGLPEGYVIMSLRDIQRFGHGNLIP